MINYIMNDIYKIKDAWLKNAKINKEQYEKMYEESISENELFWSKQGKRIEWFKPYNNVKDVIYSKDEVRIKWFFDGSSPSQIIAVLLGVFLACLSTQL